MSPLAEALRALPSSPVTRFAPSPTGWLHLGHVVNAIYVWGAAGVTGGRVLLRIEDHDRGRCRPAFEAGLLDDLDWLGFQADSGRHPVDRQSDHEARYQAAADALRRDGLTYGCVCSRRAIGGEHYPGTCRMRGIAEGPGVGTRLRMPQTIEHVHDLRLGPQADAADRYGDVLIRDREGCWTYQFAVTVDDLADGIDLIVRGEDLLSSTARQRAIGRLLGRRSAAAVLHHPLIRHTDGRKLSKSAGDAGVRERRARGDTPAAVIGAAAAAVGLVPPGAHIRAAEVASLVLDGPAAGP